MKQSSIRSTLHLTLIALLVPGLISCARLPRKPSSFSVSQNERAQNAGDKRIKLNSATITELEQLPGVGKVLAERIVAHRDKYGPFRRVEHLMVVRGISERKFRDLRPLIDAD